MNVSNLIFYECAITQEFTLNLYTFETGFSEDESETLNSVLLPTYFHLLSRVARPDPLPPPSDFTKGFSISNTYTFSGL